MNNENDTGEEMKDGGIKFYGDSGVESSGIPDWAGAWLITKEDDNKDFTYKELKTSGIKFYDGGGSGSPKIPTQAGAWYIDKDGK